MTNLLELQNLKKYFATQKAVDDMSFPFKGASLDYWAPMVQVKPLCLG